ncbi:hypothetical protein IFM89_038768 [Coptis chinensis]|uniref:RBR-type E3 ubiquitin transferase n=1 Tax=Coptis chinensis TaxID=261450 RepID=A0A835J012_9MAGN|nr:hypothetical protein IFM89_038768 [Coptis chinensis]
MDFEDEDGYTDAEEEELDSQGGSDFGGHLSEEDENKDCGHNHTALCEADIRNLQEQVITEVSSVLNITKYSATVLLSQYNWDLNKVKDDWFADEEKVRNKVGLMEKPVHNYPPGKKEINCRICFDDFLPRDMVSASCGHMFCKLCWKGYITTSINDGPGCLTMRCPEIKCVAAVGEDMVNTLISNEEIKRKYSRLLLCSYVEVKRNVKWCPAPDCDSAVEFVMGSEMFDVVCNCKYNFCWNCLEETHRPVECDTVVKWMLKNSAESENVTWILANSKPCPKCKRPIQKNAGGFYACNRYEAAKQKGLYGEEEKRREMAKSMIEKYTHYYERWQANNKSRTKAVADLHQVETVQINILRDGQGESDAQLKFITEAWEQIIECRRVLKWTYASGFYLPEDEPEKRQFFEFLQGDAESGLERLHECAEKD